MLAPTRELAQQVEVCVSIERNTLYLITHLPPSLPGHRVLLYRSVLLLTSGAAVCTVEHHEDLR